MSAIISTLKDLFGRIVYPKTLTSAVYDSSNNRLDQTLADTVHFDNDGSITPISDPTLRVSDIATTLGDSDAKPASQKLVKTVNTNINETLSGMACFDDDETVQPISDPVLHQSDVQNTLGNSTTLPASQNLVNELKNSELTPQSFSLTVDTAHFSMTGYKAVKMGKFIEIAGDIGVTDNAYKTSLNFSQCFNIPSGYRPSYGMVFNVIDTTNDKPINGTVAMDGKVYINRDYTTSCSALRVHVLYMMD